VAKNAKDTKGPALEELLRAYFLRGGFFAVRAVPFQHFGEDLTDVDIWLYERPTGSSRRRLIVDAKSKTKPKAIERLFWTKGLAELLDVDGAYIATTDARPLLREFGRKLGLLVLDGADLKRIQRSEKIIFPERLSEEQFIDKIKSIDKIRRNKNIEAVFHDIKASLLDQFGPATVNRSLEYFSFCAEQLTLVHLNSNSAEVFVRLSYLSAAIVALSLDFIGSEISFRTADERRSAFENVIRFGNLDEDSGLAQVRLATALIEKYVPNGEAISSSVTVGLKKDLSIIPADIIGEYIVNHMKLDDLFKMAKKMEFSSYLREIRSFDELDIDARSFLAVLLDFSRVDRMKFAKSWTGVSAERDYDKSNHTDLNDGPLFQEKREKK
jgi:hypothetical protein